MRCTAATPLSRGRTKRAAGVALWKNCRVLVTVGWAIKTSVSRYASERSYYSLRPLFVGLLFGDVAGQAFSSVIVGMLMTVGVI